MAHKCEANFETQQTSASIAEFNSKPIKLSDIEKDNSLPHSLRVVIQCAALISADLLAYILAAVSGTLVIRSQGQQFISLNTTNELTYSQITLFAVFAVLWLGWFGVVKQVYTRRKPFWTDLKQIFTGVLVFALLNAALSGLSTQGFSKNCWFVSWFTLLFLIPIARQTSRLLLRRFNLWNIPTLIFGTGDNAKEAYLALESEPAMGFDVKAFVVLSTGTDSYEDHHQRSPVAGKPMVVIAQHPLDLSLLLPYHCVIALEAHERDLRDTAIKLFNRQKINDVHVIPAMRGVPLYGMETTHFFSHEVLLIQLRNNLANPIHRLSKRVFDLLGSTVLLLLLSPLFAVLAYMVAKDGGKPIFGHVRVGQNNKHFKCYKFRSMVVNAGEVLERLLASDPIARAEWVQDFKLKSDPRVSKLGAFLRSSSLDELPQLYNVFKGEMSLVGPRPVIPVELERYGEDVGYYLTAKPGMTGLWQVSGRNDVDYATRVYLDSWYVKNWSLWTDIAILFKTVSVVIRRSGAY